MNIQDYKFNVAFDGVYKYIPNYDGEFVEEFKKGWDALESANYGTAKTIFETIANHGNPAAQWALGAIYYVGEGVPQDDEQAIHWYEKSANQGYAPAQANLGYMYQEGLGVPPDAKRAVELFEKSAKQGWAPGQYALGTLYQNGEGVPQDDEKAAYWIEKAALLGWVPALEHSSNDFSTQLELVRLESELRKKRSACFIATAVYDSAPKVMFLREYRDSVLLPSSLGRRLVEFYYRTSPPIADFISQHPWLKTVVKYVIIEPIVWFIKKTG
jgi:hypothetical protein